MEKHLDRVMEEVVNKPGVIGCVFVDHQGLCLGAKGKASTESAGLIAAIAEQAAKLEPHSSTPIITLENDNKSCIIQRTDEQLSAEMWTQAERNVYCSSLFGGAGAGLSVDIALFPLDTVKTRLQSAQGFLKSGGFKGIYKGIGPQVIGSAPQAALFFLTYESFKYYLEPRVDSYFLPVVHMAGAAAGEIVACLIRVPMEVVKQRRQTSTNAKHTSRRILMHAVKSEGLIKGLYRGFGSTILREIPFSLIQFPVLEYLKRLYRVNFKNNIPLESWEVANCGAVSGGFAAAVTTPLDVAKTRIMLAHRKEAVGLTVRSVLGQVYKEQGLKGIFAGFTPRVMWITIGGYIFFGMYDVSKKFCTDYILESELEVQR